MILISKDSSKRILALLFFILATGFTGIPQVSVERSHDKVVISGISYYLHLVRKGETIYSVSKAYGIDTEELLKENPSAAGGLKEGQSLRIKVSMVDTAPSLQQLPQRDMVKDEKKFVYHKLQPGETVYRLSKNYNVSEEEILRSNPGLDISKLPLGYEIAIPRTGQTAKVQATGIQDQNAYYHKVTRGETISSIARLYGISPRDLRKENRDIRFPQVGDYLKIPGMKAPAEKYEMPVTADTVPPVFEEEPIYLGRPAGYTDITHVSGSFNVAILLPFYISDNARRNEIDSSRVVKGKKIYREINRADDWIYPRSLGFIEMYEGMLLAADTLRSLGLNIRISAFDLTGDTAAAIRLINSGKLDRMDLIIGPVHSGNLSIVASYAAGLGIPVVSPVQLSNNTVLRNNPLLFMASPSIEVAREAIAAKMKQYTDKNIVLITSQTGEDPVNSASLYSLIEKELATYFAPQEIKVREMPFISRSSLSRDSVNRLAFALSPNTGNIIIIASEDPPVMSESITDIHALARKYNMEVFAYPAMRYLDNIDHKICFDLGLMIYSPYWIDYTSPDVIQFNNDFRNKFLTEPSEFSYAWQGFDLFYYFLSGLAIHGREFLNHPEIHKPDLLHTEFDFRRTGLTDGFENRKLYLIKYSNSYDLELVNDEDIEGQDRDYLQVPVR